MGDSDESLAAPMDFSMGRLVHKVVLTGGPCAGKTTAQANLSSFFENLGWKVYRVPEAANLLLSGGVRFPELSEDDCFAFQQNLLKTMMQIEETFMELAETAKRNVLIVCDRGTMDASAYLPAEGWEKILRNCSLNAIDIRDNRYNQIIHLVTAAKGAETFYTLANSSSRSEGIELARDLDDKVMRAWIGHPYLEVIDNSTNFDMKMRRLVAAVCDRLGLDTGDRLAPNSKKRKFLIKALPVFPEAIKFEDFNVEHDYLSTVGDEIQVRLRKRGWNKHWGYTHTIRRQVLIDRKYEKIENRTQITERDYFMLLAQRDPLHYRVYKKRRCFLWNNQYFQLDIYTEKNPSPYRGLLILETFTTKSDRLALPDFLEVKKEITSSSEYSMFNLSRKTDAPPPPKTQEKSKSPVQFEKIDIGPGAKLINIGTPISNGVSGLHPDLNRAVSVAESGNGDAHKDAAKTRSVSEVVRPKDFDGTSS